MNIFKEILHRNLLKLLNFYNLDKYSATSGNGDREYWGWNTKDFANATMQGGVHALAIAYRLELAENKKFILHVINAAIQAIARIRSKNGSVAEAYPNENSFCVTALVAFDVLAAINYLKNELPQEKQEEYINIIKPLISFITKNDEEHAVISNHLATGAAAILLWNNLTGSQNTRYRELLEIIYKNQSPEGWYREYEGADPGYQTLCTYYLAQVYGLTKDEKLKSSLMKSLEYLQYFVHPDGSIGGLYGSRNTEVFYPGGLVALASISETSAAIIRQFKLGIERGNHVLPDHIDVGNYIPLLNSYALAALMYGQNASYIERSRYELPCKEIFEKQYNDAGIYIKSTATYYVIINYKKGGTIKVFNKVKNVLDAEDGGLIGVLKNGEKFSTQIVDESVSFERGTLLAKFYKINEDYPTPLAFIVLRLLSMTILKNIFLGNVFKKLIIKKLMTGKKPLDGSVQRSFQFLEDKILVREKISPPQNSKEIRRAGKTTAIHMASSGYHTKQVEYLNSRSETVEFHEA